MLFCGSKQVRKTETTQAAFEAVLKRRYEQYAAFLNERSVNEKIDHSHYTHKHLRTAIQQPETVYTIVVCLRTSFRFGHPEYGQSAERTIQRHEACVNGVIRA